MKVFFAVGFESSGCRCGGCEPAFHQRSAVVAPSESEALDFLLKEWPSTTPEMWTLTEIDLTDTTVREY